MEQRKYGRTLKKIETLLMHHKDPVGFHSFGGPTDAHYLFSRSMKYVQNQWYSSNQDERLKAV